MTQQWLTVAGLGLDFAGFMLLLREWWLAFFNEARQIVMEEQAERVRALRHLRPAQDDAAVRKARGAHRAAMSARKGTSFWQPC